MGASIVLTLILLAICLSMGVAWLLLIATQFLFGFPTEITFPHVLATWFVMAVVSSIFKR